MSWLTLDDNMPDHPKIRGLTDRAFRLHVYALCYCSRHLTDGVIPASACRGVVDNSSRYCRELVAKKLWQSRDEVFVIHDYLDWNKSRADVENQRKLNQEAGRKGAQRRWHPDSDRHGERYGERNGPPLPYIKEGLDLRETMPSDAARFAAVAARGVKSVNGNLGRPVALQPKAGCSHEMQRKDEQTWKCSLCGLEQVD